MGDNIHRAQKLSTQRIREFQGTCKNSTGDEDQDYSDG